MDMGEPLTVKVARVGYNDGASCLEFIERGGHCERSAVVVVLDQGPIYNRCITPSLSLSLRPTPRTRALRAPFSQRHGSKHSPQSLLVSPVQEAVSNFPEQMRQPIARI
jgi:hypothetical protein